ncbi:MAG TPA: hypothetical protein VKV40_17205 [Ktedonobacteraceae bacterium]|nr:hypothetical protein [Ktedonobacteraceae bacterium]
MLHKSVPFTVLFRVAGILFLVFGLYHAYTVASVTLGGGEDIPGTLIAILGPFGGDFPYGAPLIYIAFGLFCLGLSSTRAKLAYWGLQLACWLTGLNLWYQQHNEITVHLIPPFATPTTFWPQMVITLLCSLLLLALYIPIIRLLNKLYEVIDEQATGETGHEQKRL